MSERIYQGIIGVLVLVILIGGAVMIGGHKSSPATMDMNSMASSSDSATAGADSASADTSDSQVPQATVASGSDSVSVVDQPAGSSVDVKSVSLAKRGWVTVRQDGWYLGAQRLEAGTYSDVKVPLLRNTKAGSTYEVVLFYDNGDGTFGVHKDTIVTKADGSDLSAAFIAK